jgi:large subunit ribosomal protein L6
MSRIGKKPIQVPGNVKVSVDPASRTVAVEGPKGKLSLVYRPEVTVAWDQSEKKITVSIPKEKEFVKQVRAFWGLTRANIANLIQGVTDGYTEKLEVNGVGWNAKLQGQTVVLNLGYCNPITVKIPMGITVTVEGNVVTISGTSKQLVGQVAAEIRSKRTPEPYNAKGVKYMDEVIIRKQGKAVGT